MKGTEKEGKEKEREREKGRDNVDFNWMIRPPPLPRIGANLLPYFRNLQVLINVICHFSINYNGHIGGLIDNKQ